MRFPQLDLLRAVALLGASQLLLSSLPAQTATNHTGSAQAGSGLTPRVVPRLPPLPRPGLLSASPITFFRELLAMTPAQQQQALTNRSPQSRTMIVAKLREYESLKPDERELRLRVTELRWYLRPLMTAPATNRPAQLTMVPESYRELVQNRLREWDKLSPDVQQELLAHEATIRYLTEIEGRTPEQRRQKLESIPPGSRTALEKGIDEWSSMSEDRRGQMLSRFREFFELTPAEKQKALNSLSGPERSRIERTLRTFGNLPPDQRDACLRSFEKFATLSPAERQQFLKSAEHWKQMSPTERQVWRELVTHLPPPLPPRPPLPHPRQPPRPPTPIPAVVTNGN